MFGDVTTAFLHAELPTTSTIHVRPPKEYYKHIDKVWRLKKPLYGLKTSPKEWQDYFTNILKELGGRQMKSDPNVYYFEDDKGKNKNYVLVYVDDLVILGDNPDELFDKIANKVLLKRTGELKQGETISFLGRRLRHTGETIELLPAENYIEEILEEHGLTTAKPCTTPGSTSRKTTDGVSQLSTTETTQYRRTTGN